MDMGAATTTSRSVQPTRVRARIRALLRRVVPAVESVQRVGDCELDFGPRRSAARRSGVDLTAIELKMLDVFVRNPGRVMTRAVVINDVWGDVFVTDRVVDTHIVKLRRKIERDPAEPQHIVSVRGIGYRFEP